MLTQPSNKQSIDRLATQPVRVPDSRELPTKMLIPVSHLIEQPTIPLRIRRAFSLAALRWWIPLLLYLLLLFGFITGRASFGTWLSVFYPAHHGNNSIPLLHTHRAFAHSTAIDSAEQDFLGALMKKDWAAMWSQLAPGAQQLYQGEADFIHFEQAKFGKLTLHAFTTSPVEILQPWLDPDTSQIYTQAAVLQVSLDATAPPGLLTEPSRAALQGGLLRNTLCAFVQVNTHWKLAIAGPADLDAPVLVPTHPPKVKLLVPIFMYHHVSNKPATNALDFNLTVTTRDFDAQLSWLQAQGYASITMTELFDALYFGKALPAHPMILTFDDGYEDMYTDAMPTLLAHHYRGVFYIITGLIGGRYMTWEQVRILSEYGMQIASHTVHHVNIGQPPAYTTRQDELTLSKQTLEQRLGEPIQFFCYPTGEPFHHDTLYEQQLVLTDLFNDGYVGATLDPFSFDSTIQNAQAPYQLPRVRVSGGESLRAFEGILQETLKLDTQRLQWAAT